MAALINSKTIGGGFTNAIDIERVVYDFALDAGATGSLDVLIAEDACVVKLKHAAIKTAFTSSGSLTLSVGKATAGVQMLDTVGLAALTLGAILDGQSTVKLAAGEKIQMTIGTAAATAGKAEFVFEVMRY